MAQTWHPLTIGIIGGGIGGLSAAIALRRAGHLVTVYERNDFAGEVGASVSCAANGSRWLHAWDVDVTKGDPVVLRRLINRDWSTGEPVSTVDLGDYEERWGAPYYMFHRRDLHAALMECAVGEDGVGRKVELRVKHACVDIEMETNTVVFKNGVRARHDLIVGADGIGSAVRRIIGIQPAKRPAESSCLHANVNTEQAVKLGLTDYSVDNAIEYWGGQSGKWDKIVLSPCNGGKLLSYYCFFPREQGDYTNQAWGAEDRPVDELLAPFPDLDARVKAHLAIGIEIQPWRLWLHDPYPYIQKGGVCLLGDAAHPMMPHQSQGACMAIEDAAALGLLFSAPFFPGTISAALDTYQTIRLPRATRVQAAAARAAGNINERIGFSANADSCATYSVASEREKLTVEEMNAYDMARDVEEKVARLRGEVYEGNWVGGLPWGLELPGGGVVGQ